jgi:hypothetical protein
MKLRMKTLALLSVLLLAGCGSSSSKNFDIPTSRVSNDCEHGDISVRVGFPGPKVAQERIEDQVMFVVEVANLARKDIVVKAIRVDQTSLETARYRLTGSYRSFNETIPEDDEHVFELPMSGFAKTHSEWELRSDSMSFEVTVMLEGGDAYRCLYSVPAPIS